MSVTIKRLTRSKQKVVLAAMLVEGKSMPSNMAANTNHTTLINYDSVDCSILHKLSDRICKGKFLWSVDPNTSTFWLFNLLVIGLLVVGCL